ncbi:hypothetical protein AKJ16_DCAP02069 [Drosera capensis]
MEIREERLLLGFPPNSRPTPSQVKAAFRERLVVCFMVDGNDSSAISEAYNSLSSGGGEGSSSVAYSRVVRTGVPVATGGRNWALMGVPFFFFIFGAVGLGGLSATRAYRRHTLLLTIHFFLDQSDSNRNPGSLVGNWARRFDLAIFVDRIKILA